MKVQNLRSYEVEIPEVGFVDAGDVIEVDDVLGKSLLMQTDAWGKPGAKKGSDG